MFGDFLLVFHITSTVYLHSLRLRRSILTAVMPGLAFYALILYLSRDSIRYFREIVVLHLNDSFIISLLLDLASLDGISS